MGATEEQTYTFLIQLIVGNALIWGILFVHVGLTLRRGRERWAAKEHNLKLQKQEIERRSRMQHTDYNARLMYLKEQVNEMERSWLYDQLNEELIGNVGKLSEHLEQIGQHLPANLERSARLEASANLLMQQARQMKAIAGHLRPDHLTELGLIYALKGFFLRNNFREQVSITVEGNDPDYRLAPEIERTLHRIATGLVMHTLQRGQATHVSIFIEVKEGHVHLHFTDNDPDFTANQIAHVPTEEKDAALLRLELLVQMIYGRLNYDVQYNRGLKLTLTVEAERY